MSCGGQGLTARAGLKIAGLCGVAEPFVAVIFLLLAISISPWFSWTDNALSDLGVQGRAAIIFNSALIVGGLLTVVFATGLAKTLRSGLSRIGALILLLDGVSLSAIGIFPETFRELHLFSAVAFFTLLPLYLLIFGVALIREASERRFGALTILLGVFSASIWMLEWDGFAIPETLAYLAGSIWSAVMGMRMFRQKYHDL